MKRLDELDSGRFPALTPELADLDDGEHDAADNDDSAKDLSEVG